MDGTVFLATPSSALVGALPAPAVTPPTPAKKEKKKKEKKKKADEAEAPEAGGPREMEGTCVLSIAEGEPRAVAWLQDAVVDVFSSPRSGGKGAEGLVFATADRRFLTLTGES